MKTGIKMAQYYSSTELAEKLPVFMKYPG